MRIPLIYSIGLHVAVVLIAVFGLPSLSDRMIAPSPVLEVSLVTDEELDQKEPEPVEEPKPEPPEPQAQKPPPPPPEPPKPPPPPPPPEPEPPAPEPEAEAVPDPVNEPKPEPKKQPEPKPEPKVAEKPPAKPAPRPRAKPKPPPPKQDFTSVLKTVEKLKEDTPRPTPKKKAEPEEKEVDLQQQVAQALDLQEKPRRRTAFLAVGGLTMGEMDALRAQIARCWSVPAGARDAENLVVEIRVEVNPDMTVRSARILDVSRMNRDPFYRTAAESALRAVLNPRCSPLQLPPQKYEEWRSMVLSFNPREMLGL